MEIKTPIGDRDIERLKVGDIVYLTGTLITARDKAHRRILSSCEDIPVNLKNMPVYHCGPIVMRENDTWRVLSAGPTTSYRLEDMESDFIECTGVKMIIGKGGMGKKTSDACKRYKAVYCSFTGGASLIGARSIVRIKDVYWLDMGMPEAIWVFEVKKFGPLVVSIDSHGRNLYDNVIHRARSQV